MDSPTKGLLTKLLTLLGLTQPKTVLVEEEPLLAFTSLEEEAGLANAPADGNIAPDCVVNAPLAAVTPVPVEAAILSEEPVPLPAQSAKLGDTAYEQLSEIRKFASWSGPEGENRLQEVLRLFKEEYPGHERKIDDAIAEGKAVAEVLERAFQAAARDGADAAALRGISRDAASLRIPERTFQKRVEKGDAAYQRRVGSREKMRAGTPLSNVKPRGLTAPARGLPANSLVARRSDVVPPPGLHANDLRALRPASHWQVLIDETGDVFSADAATVPDRRRGRFVALAVPVGGGALPPLPVGWHAVDQGTDERVDRVVQTVLDVEVGVFGISVTGLPATPGERWMDGVGLLIDWLGRLLPISGPTRVDVLVENRGVFTGGQNWELVARDSLRRLALAFPSRAVHLDLKISVIGKGGSPLNGYVDALAFTWGSPTESSRERLHRSGLLRTCLLEQSARDLLYAWDDFSQGVKMPPYLWWNLVSSDSADLSAALVASLLDSIGEECRVDVHHWTIFLDEVRRHMATGVIELGRLAAAVQWLQRYQPAGATIPPRLRLAWLTVQLADSNHAGRFDDVKAEESARLAEVLIEEVAPLVCQADLYLAVARTNRFEFEYAQTTLQKWRDVPPMAIGLQAWGQLWSSLGQHAAFLGRNEDAVALFDRALETFARLSDPADRAKETAQTGCYRAVALMDDPAVSDGSVRNAVEKVTGPVQVAAESFARSADPGARYAHHLLLRWLVHRSEPAVREVYVDQRAAWQTGSHHPWPLIQLYRALLLSGSEPAFAKELALEAAGLASVDGSGPVMHLISACCRAIAGGWGETWTGGPAEVGRLRSTLPQAATQLNILSAFLAHPTDPLSLLQEVLPFNFR